RVRAAQVSLASVYPPNGGGARATPAWIERVVLPVGGLAANAVHAVCSAQSAEPLGAQGRPEQAVCAYGVAHSVVGDHRSRLGRGGDSAGEIDGRSIPVATAWHRRAECDPGA